MDPSRLIIVIGSSGVGKSTFAQALQEALLPQQWLHFSVDSIFYCLPASIVRRVDHDNDPTAVDSKAVIRTAHACTRTLIEQGNRVIFDAVILSRAGADRLMEAFGAFDPLLVELTCAWPELERRTLARGDRTLAEAQHGFRNARGHLAVHHTFDTTSARPEELATQLVQWCRATTPPPS